jgi:hypothetical protein
MKEAVIWVVAPCSLVEIYGRFRGAYCLIVLMMKVEAATSETSVNAYRTTRCKNPFNSFLKVCEQIVHLLTILYQVEKCWVQGNIAEFKSILTIFYRLLLLKSNATG